MKHPESANPNQSPAVPKKRFHTGWFFAFFIPLLIVTAALFLFSKFLYGLEYYSPTVELEKYVQLISEQKYAEAIEFAGFKTDSAKGVKEYTAFLKEYYGDSVKEHVFIERKLQRTANDVFYDVSINNKPAMKFKLTKTGVKRLYYFDTWKLSFAGELPSKTLVIHTVPGVVLTVNGTRIGEDRLLAKPGYSMDYYKDVKDSKYQKLDVKTYQISGLLGIASLEAATETGEKCELTLLAEDKKDIQTYLVKKPVPASELEAVKARTLAITEKYAEFVAKDAGFSQLTPYLYKNTEFYDNLKGFYNGWFTGHQSYGFENIKYRDIQAYDSTHYKVGIEFDYFVYKSDKRYDYHISYNAYLLKVGEKWLLANLSIQ